MKVRIIILLAALTSFYIPQVLYAAQAAQLNQRDPQARTVLIFLDDTEKTKMGALSGGLMSALYEKAGPIITSASLLQNTFAKEKGRNFRTGLQQLFAEYHFDSTQWIVKQINNWLFLLIPKEYSFGNEQTPISSLIAKAPVAPAQLTQLEYNLGLKVDHMQSLNTQTKMALQDFFDTYQSTQQKTESYFMPAVEKQIFVERKYYIQKKIAEPMWTIYMEGHGEIGLSIVALSREQFSRCLDFFAQNLTIRTFSYSSCYAAGLNAQKIYGDLTSIEGNKVFSFPIITQALTDAPVTIKELRGGIEKLSPALDYKTFVDRSLQNDIDLLKIYAPIMPEISLKESGNLIAPGIFYASIPQIRPPYSPAFFPLVEAPNKIVSIGLTMATSRREPLIIKAKANQVPEIILLYALDISFPITFALTPQEKLPQIISMVPGKASHILNSIEAPNHPVDAILNIFHSPYLSYGISKQFWIKNLISKEGNFHDIIFEIDVNKRKLQLLAGLKETAKGYTQDPDASAVEKYRAQFEEQANLQLEQITRGKRMQLETVIRKKAGLPSLEEKKGAEEKKQIEKVSDIKQRLAKENEAIAQKLRNANLLSGASTNDRNRVMLAIEQGADINTKNSEGLTPLALAINNKHFALADYLLDHKADINASIDSQGNTLLHKAIKSTYSQEATNYLLAHKANINAQNIAGQTPLDGLIDFVKTLPVSQLYQIEAFNIYLKNIDLLTAAGAKANAVGRATVKAKTKERDTALQDLLGSGKPYQTEQALKFGAKSTQPLTTGMLPIDLLLSKMQTPIKTLDDVTQFDDLKKSIDLLTQSGAKLSAEAVKKLQTKTAERQEALNQTLYDADVSNSTYELALIMGANIESSNKFGLKPLHSAIASGNIYRIRLLLERGAKVDERALQMAHRWADQLPEIEKILQELKH